MKSKKKETQDGFFQAQFNTYGGKKRFAVKHPDFKEEVVCAAPNADSAIVAAASYWKRDWTRIAFYAYYSVRTYTEDKE